MFYRFLIPGFIALIMLSSCSLRSVTEPRRIDPAGEPTPVPTRVPVASATYVSQTGDIVREITLSGAIVPVSQLELHFAAQGQVAAVFVETGAEVEAGAVLAELNTTALQTELTLARSALEVAQAQLAAAETLLTNNHRRAEIAVEKLQLRLDTLRQDAGDQPTAEQALQLRLLELDLELARLDLTELENSIDPALEAAVAQNQLHVDGLEVQLAAAQIVAPAAGTILRVNARPDQLIAPNDVAMILADVNNLELRALAGDEDLALMLEGMSGIAQRAGRPGPEVSAELTTLPVEFGGKGREQNIVRFTLANQGQDFELGDRATVVLVVGERQGVVWLPPQAIREFRGRQFVVIQEGEGQRRVDVETGLSSGDRVEIVSGLAEGVTVIGE